MISIIDECKKYDTFLFADEAFIEFTTGGLNNSIVNEVFFKIIINLYPKID